MTVGTRTVPSLSLLVSAKPPNAMALLKRKCVDYWLNSDSVVKFRPRPTGSSKGWPVYDCERRIQMSQSQRVGRGVVVGASSHLTIFVVPPLQDVAVLNVVNMCVTGLEHRV